MSLVPFASSTPPVASPVASRSTAAGSPRPAVGGGAAPASTRPHGIVREGTSGTHGGKVRAGFAHVLAAVQDQEPQPDGGSPAPSGTAATDTPTTPAETTTERKPLEAAEVRGVVHDPGPAMSTETQTPWLLLALGAGPWSDPRLPGQEAQVVDEGASDSATVTGPDAAIVPSPAPPPIALADTPAAPVSVTDGATDGVAASPGVPGVAPSEIQAARPDQRVVADEAAPAPAVRELAERPAAPREAGGAPLAFEDAPPPVDDADAPQDREVAPPAPEMLARWRAASRGAGETREFGVPPLTMEREVEPSLPAASGTAASRLAQVLGGAGARVAQGTPNDQAVPSVPLVAVESAPQATTAPAPGTRPADIVMRLSQAGFGPATRKGPEVAASAAVFAQMLSSAMPTPTEVPTASAPVQAPVALPNAVGDQVLAQVVSSLKLQWKDGVGEAKLHLRPDALGTVSVTLRVEAGAVTAVVRADNPQVQEWVLQHQPSLRQQMEAAGLRLDDLVVSPDDQRQQPQGQSEQEPEKSPRRRSGDDAGDARPDGTRFEMLL